MRSPTMVKDPVCGMDLETDTAAARIDHLGQTYYFCGFKCKDKFDRDREQYVSKTGSPKSGEGCCGGIPL